MPRVWPEKRQKKKKKTLNNKKIPPGVSTVVHWVKNLMATAWVSAEAQVQSLAQELPYVVGVALKGKKTKKKKLATV